MVNSKFVKLMLALVAVWGVVLAGGYIFGRERVIQFIERRNNFSTRFQVIDAAAQNFRFPAAPLDGYYYAALYSNVLGNSQLSAVLGLHHDNVMAPPKRSVEALSPGAFSQPVFFLMALQGTIVDQNAALSQVQQHLSQQASLSALYDEIWIYGRNRPAQVWTIDSQGRRSVALLMPLGAQNLLLALSPQENYSDDFFIDAVAFAFQAAKQQVSFSAPPPPEEPAVVESKPVTPKKKKAPVKKRK